MTIYADDFLKVIGGVNEVGIHDMETDKEGRIVLPFSFVCSSTRKALRGKITTLEELQEMLEKLISEHDKIAPLLTSIFHLCSAGDDTPSEIKKGFTFLDGAWSLLDNTKTMISCRRTECMEAYEKGVLRKIPSSEEEVDKETWERFNTITRYRNSN